MKTKRCRLYRVYFLILMIFFLTGAPGCKKSNIEALDPEGILLSYQGCKQETSSTFYKHEQGMVNQQEQECIVFEYNGSVLTLKHVNAFLNCCPGEITAEIQCQEQSILITEREAQLGCFCDCYYDIDFQINNIGPGVYTISIRHDNQETFACTIDLASSSQGEICQ